MRDGKKAFEADAYHEREAVVLEVEAGRGVVSNQFLKDVFQACMMDGVHYLCIAVWDVESLQKSRDFERVEMFMDTLYASNRLSWPLNGILITAIDAGSYISGQFTHHHPLQSACAAVT